MKNLSLELNIAVQNCQTGKASDKFPCCLAFFME